LNLAQTLTDVAAAAKCAASAAVISPQVFLPYSMGLASLAIGLLDHS
jgi:hypothetical protein